MKNTQHAHAERQRITQMTLLGYHNEPAIKAHREAEIAERIAARIAAGAVWSAERIAAESADYSRMTELLIFPVRRS